MLSCVGKNGARGWIDAARGRWPGCREHSELSGVGNMPIVRFS